jgi:NitT/TauT family transport system ATP-binding protein
VGGRTPHEAYEDFAFVFQSPRLVGWRDALQNVTLASELRKGRTNRRQAESRAQELLSLVGLARDARKRAGDLSGGERQRVAIARALHVDPQTVLMDEPFSALDVRTRETMRREIISIWEQQRKTVVFVTHDVDEALFLADRIIVFSRKPTTVLATVPLSIPRLRDLDHDPAIRDVRKQLLQMLREGGAEL